MPSRTTSFSCARNANESLAAASTTASFIEFEPMSIAASFNPQNAPHCIKKNISRKTQRDAFRTDRIFLALAP
jgi:hypothetical protein